jgi:uncharacterized protein (DUF433 family)
MVSDVHAGVNALPAGGRYMRRIVQPVVRSRAVKSIRVLSYAVAVIAEKARPPYNMNMKQAVICRDLEVMGGAPVFCGTRVPVQTLLDHLEAGESIDEFLQGFPSVTRAQVIAFLEQAKDRLVESVS